MALFCPTAYSSHPIIGVDIYLWQLTESLSELCMMLHDSSVLSCEPFITFKSDKRKREWVAVRVLLGQIVQQPIAICYEANGKPYLCPNIANLSISHTRDVVGVALSDRSVGMDVEQKGSRPLRLIGQFVHPDDFHPEIDDQAEVVAVFMWSAKESVYKLLGVPGIELLADIRLAPIIVDHQYSEFYARIPRISKTAIVRCYSFDTFVLTIATYS